MNTAPLCKDCLYYVKGRWPQTDMCSRFIAYRGRGKIVHEWASSVRLRESKCGPEGKLFVSVKNKEKVENWSNLLEVEE